MSSAGPTTLAVAGSSVVATVLSGTSGSSGGAHTSTSPGTTIRLRRFRTFQLLFRSLLHYHQPLRRQSQRVCLLGEGLLQAPQRVYKLRLCKAGLCM